MSMNFDDLFEAAAKEFESAFTRSSIGIRPDEKGGPREQQLRQFLSDWLPNQCGIANGYVINKERGISRQCDVILFNSTTCPKFMLDKETDRRLVPIGDIYGTIEVKSSLGAKELIDALAKIQSVYDIHYGEFYNEPGPSFSDRYSDETYIEAVEVKRNDNFKREIKSYIPDNKWSAFKVRLLNERLRRSVPFSIIFAYKLSKELSLEKVVDILKDHGTPPHAIFVLDRGFLIRISKDGIKRFKSLKQGRPIRDYDYDTDAMLVPSRIQDNFRYMSEENWDSKATLMYFYSFLLDLIKDQKLTDYIYTDLIAVWRKDIPQIDEGEDF